MRLSGLLSILALACSASMSVGDQIPDKALCSVCALKGGETELEKVKAHSEHDGKAHYFCSKDCKEEFDADPAAFLPSVLPRPAPAFTVQMLGGGDLALDDLKGKVVLIDFWATWCKPCLETMPELNQLQADFSGDGFSVVGVSVDEVEDGAKKVRKMVDKLGITYPICLDTKQTPAWHQLKVKAIPAIFLLDQGGQIVAQWMGKVDLAEVRAEVAKRMKVD